MITDQQVTSAAGLQALGSTAFTISDLSAVWVVCDVYENDLPNVRVGDAAEIRLNAYPDQRAQGHDRQHRRGPRSEPAHRQGPHRGGESGDHAPGHVRHGDFRGQTKETHTVVPASAVLHLHDRDWVYVPAPEKRFRRVEVVAGQRAPDSLQEIKSGLEPGQQLVADALVLDHALEQ